VEDLISSTAARARRERASVESHASWVVAIAILFILSVAFGAPYLAVVALKPIAAELGSERSVPALASALAWLGCAVGGLAMGRIADRIGMRWTALFGAVMIAAGLALAASGGVWRLWIGYGILVGLLGLAGLNAPAYVYISRWFDRRRGTALALISSGLYLAGAVWPEIFQLAIDRFGWRQTMTYFAILVIILIVPTAAIFLGWPPETPAFGAAGAGPRSGERVLGWPPGVVVALLSLAAICCCMTMAMPQAHLVAFCSDLGIASTHGAAMLSLLLASAFFSRQLWGWIADRIGGLGTVLAGSACQAAAMTAFLLTQDEIGLFTVAAFFGFGFSGIVPAYVLAIRELFPAAEAGWRIPTLLLCSGSGMAAGSWLAGALYDYFGFYAPAFAAGVGINLVNLALVGTLVYRQQSIQPAPSLVR